MVKQSSSVRSSALLFDSPVPYDEHPARKTVLVSVDNDSSGASVINHVVVEDEMAKIIAMSYDEVSLSNLLDKGVDTHSLDIMDTSKLGIDAGAAELASHLINNSDKYVESQN